MKEAQKQMVQIRTPESPYFEEVYFILRAPEGKADESTLLSEARRILTSPDAEREAERLYASAKRDRDLWKRRGRAFLYLLISLCSALGGGAVTVVLWLCFSR